MSGAIGGLKQFFFFFLGGGGGGGGGGGKGMPPPPPLVPLLIDCEMLHSFCLYFISFVPT